MSPRRVLCLAGPTGAGKTALALRLARALDGEVVNADSRQVYADFPVITAQPAPEERAQAPHHLYGFLATDRGMDVQTWMDMAVGVVDDILARGRVPLLVGGTGMYFHRLLHGIADVPDTDPEVRARLAGELEEQGSPALHRRLGELDPVLARRLHPNDRQRILRGLEVALSTGRPLTWWQTERNVPPPCEGPLLVVDTPLKELEPVLARRVDAMLTAGALEEAATALEHCPDPKAPGWSGIGCRELLGHLTGQCDLVSARELWIRNTRAYAKRQITWFRGRAEARFIGARDADRALAIWKGNAP